MGFPERQREELNKFFLSQTTVKPDRNVKNNFETLNSVQRRATKLRCVYSSKPTETWLRTVGLYDISTYRYSHHPFNCINIIGLPGQDKLWKTTFFFRESWHDLEWSMEKIPCLQTSWLTVLIVLANKWERLMWQLVFRLWYCLGHW